MNAIPGSMGRMVAVLGLLLTACAQGADDGSAPSISSQVPPAVNETRAGVYTAMIEELAGREGGDWDRVWVVTSICANASDPTEPRHCDDAFSLADQQELRSRFTGVALRFIEDPAPLYDADWMAGAPHQIVLRLGPIETREDGVEVGASYGCGGLCGSGTTYRLAETDRGWEVTGTTGPAWIA